jgi:DNA repair exonuclease SbcCD ATPase subunit/DNA repair exonuclease SbcCD nuclease subunit
MIEKIYHVADIHIRNLQRHKEYRLVFEKFLAQVRKDNYKNAVIYLAGDIAHAKTEMSPELVQEISWLFTECAKLHDTFIITGNHDCNLNNNYRLDVLTPIVENLNNPKLHYMRDTGIYPFKNLNWVVYSILDKKENWPSGNDIDLPNTICCFHGPVNKAKTDIGYIVSSNSFTVDMFEGFDMALLGDIHKRQTFGSDWENVAYAGSMIQQNHGEVLEKHGYLLWDVASRTFTEHHIHNDYGYLTIDVVDGKIPQWVYDEIGTKLPKHPRLRLRFTSTQAAQMKLCITELKQLFKVAEITVTRTDTIGQLKQNNKLNKNIVGEVNDVTFQNQLIRDYLERQYLLEDSELNHITDINADMNSRIDDSKIAENILWTPKTFEFSNMFSYGEGNKIEFEKAHGILGIFAPNTAGKSSLFDALSFCIFDKSARTNSSKHILNNRKENFYCKFSFEIDGVEYFIERTAKWTRKKTNLKVDVNFWKEDAGIPQSLNGEQRRETNKNIEHYLGKFEDFVLTTLSVQGNDALFIDKSQSERKEILSQFIGVDIFDKLYKIAADENKDNATIIRKFNKDDFTTKLADYSTNLIKYNNEYKVKEIELNTVSERIDRNNKELMALNKQIVKLNVDSVDITELLKRKATLSNNEKEIIKKREDTSTRIEALEKLQLQLEEILDGIDDEQHAIDLLKLRKVNTRMVAVKNELDKINIKIDGLNDKIAHLDSHKYNEKCDICMENSKSIIQSRNDAQLSLYGEDKMLYSYECERDVLDGKLLELNDVEATDTLFNDTHSKETKVSREIATLITRVGTCETDEVKVQLQIVSYQKLIDDYYKNETQIKENKKIRTSIDATNAILSIAKRNHTKLNSEILKLNGKISTIKTQIQVIKDRILEVNGLEEQTKLYKYYLNALGKDGVSYELIEKALPMIEGEVNNILAQIVEFGIQFEIDGKNINAYLVYGDQRWSLEMCSGMERFISGLAIRVALINVCNLPRPNFLVIDEGFGTLDSENMQSLYMLFTYLKTQFDFVMIISHIDSLRDVVDNLIEIKKEDGFSNVRF